jgi:hypothetical protein
MTPLKKRLLEVAETGLLRPNSWHVDCGCGGGEREEILHMLVYGGRFAQLLQIEVFRVRFAWHTYIHDLFFLTSFLLRNVFGVVRVDF